MQVRDDDVLLIIDVQNDFIHPEGFMARRRLAGFADTTSMVAPAIERLEVLLAGARRVVQRWRLRKNTHE